MKRCLMCGEPIVFSEVWQWWDHVKGGSMNCDGKASVATPDD